MDKKDIVEGEFKSYKFLEPFNTILSNKTVYEVTKKFTLKSMLADGFDPKKNVYELYNLSDEDYEEDLAVDMSIIELSLGSRRYYVPVDRIISKEITTNVHYGERSAIIKLGWIPEDEKLDSLMEDIRLLVKDTLGIDPVLDSATVGVVVSIPVEEHNDREAARALLRQEPGNYKRKYFDLKQMNSLSINKLKALETAEINSRLQPQP